MQTLSARIVGLLVLGSCFASAQTKPPQPAPEYGQPPADLANALVQMAKNSHVPLIAELVWPLPNVSPPGGTPANEEALNRLVQAAPGYDWKFEGKALHFYNKRLHDAKFNFLNCKFPRFTIPPNLSDLKLWFPPRSIGLLEGYTGEGGAISGFRDESLGKQSLQRAVLENVTPLQVLFHVADESPTFYTVLVFPSAHPSRSDAENRVNWQWGSLSEPQKPIYAQPSPRKPGSETGENK
jgi:hypothetical protein